MKNRYLDLLERATWTFIQAASAVILVEQNFGAAVWKVAAVAGGLAVVKALVAFQSGDRNSASF